MIRTVTKSLHYTTRLEKAVWRNCSNNNRVGLAEDLELVVRMNNGSA